MKNRSLMFMVLFAIMACAPPKTFTYYRTGEVNCIANDNRLVTVQSLSHGGSREQAQLFAERNALENILFKGVPGCYDVPIVENENSSISQHQSFYNWLIEEREYEQYVTDRVISQSSASGGEVAMRLNITFDIQALRKEMERRGVIKKFGI